jgi:oligoendopeptidase F
MEQIRKRKFIPVTLELNRWEDMKPYFEQLFDRPVDELESLENWMTDLSELSAAVAEELGWRYIEQSRDTESEEKRERYQDYVGGVLPEVQRFSDRLNRKLVASPAFKELDARKYLTYTRSVKKELELFREENIVIQADLAKLQQSYGVTIGKQSIEFKGQEYTLPQANLFLKEIDREIREKVYFLIQKRKLEDKESLDKLLDDLIVKRQEMANNADFDNYRDYKFKAMGRFDYDVQSCFDFHQSISRAIVPLISELEVLRKDHLGIDRLRPWDFGVDMFGKEPIAVFDGTQEDLLAKTVKLFDQIDPYFSSCLRTMDEMGHLDLQSRKGKAPGGYNYPLYETGVPFIFMNAAGSLRDLVTLIHEGGHAVHSFLTRNYPLKEFQRTPSEVAELASMSMELIAMEHWDVLFTDEQVLRRAKIEHLEKVLSVLPWIARIDAFQHWIYTNEHSAWERAEAWMEISSEYSTGNTDYSDINPEFRHYQWQGQLHIYEVPFYYIEYGMAQLGAIAIWRNYKKDPERALDAYKRALKLGYTKTIGEIYAEAEIEFDFSEDYVIELASFVRDEIHKLIK